MPLDCFNADNLADLAWHTHMLFPDSYRKFTSKFLGKFLNHDDTIPESRLDQYIKDTDYAWKSRLENRGQGAENTTKNTSEPVPMPKRTNRVTIKLKNLFKKADSDTAQSLSSDMKTFKGRYNAGTYQPSPAYKPTDNDNQSVKQDTDVYDVENTSFHDKRTTHLIIAVLNAIVN